VYNSQTTVPQQKQLANVWRNSIWAEAHFNNVFILADGRKVETRTEIRVYGVSIQIIVSTEPNNELLYAFTLVCALSQCIVLQ
jgi:hypothetical protein